MRIRDPVHNFVEIPDEFKLLVDSPVLQRLRGIRQLALASLVYPGALHTRFDHTLGVTHVAGRMSDVLNLDRDERRLVQLAALLHDVGHGPFSHVSEASLVRYADSSKLESGQNPHKIHELVTAQIIRSDDDICKVLPNEVDRENVVRLLDEGVGRRILRQIVSGPIDSDKQDYLLRDSKFCGVEYGIFDLQQLHRSLIVFGDKGDEEIIIGENGVHPAEQFMLAKYYMTSNVYRHRVRLITDQMIGRAIRLGIDVDKVEVMRNLFRFDNSSDFVRNYLAWDDQRFMEEFCPLHSSPPGAMSGELLCRLRRRHLLKEVYRERLEMLDARFRETMGEISKHKFDQVRDQIERAVAEFLSSRLSNDCPPEFVIVHSYSIKSVRESSQNDESQILVQRGDRPRLFTDESKLLGSINAAYSDDFVGIYAPISWPNPEEKGNLRLEWQPQIREIIENECRKSRNTLKGEMQ